MLPARELYSAGLFAFALGALAGLGAHWWFRNQRFVSTALCLTALTGSVLEGAAALGSLWFGSHLAWSISSGIPNLTYEVRLDPLGSFFLLTLSLLAVSVCVYSFGYWKHGGSHSSAFSGSLLNLLLARSLSSSPPATSCSS